MKVKICGITNLDDALAAVEHGADALGFIFAPSPRQVASETVKAIVDELPPFVTKVGVFVNSDLDEIRQKISICGLDLAQLHESESPGIYETLFPRAIKVFTPGNLPSLAELNRYRVAAYMLDKAKGSDTKPEELWPIATDMSNYGQVILAGGLTPENVSQAIKVAQPYAVDVASGVEKEPGKKDHAMVRDFIREAKGQLQ